MFETEFHIGRLISAQLQGTITAGQQAELQNWINTSEANQQHYEQFINEEQIKAKLARYQQVNSQTIFNHIRNGIAGKDQPATEVTTSRKQIRLWHRISVAAALALIIAGISYYKRPLTNWFQYPAGPVLTRDIAPGNVGATLTLASGRQIKLSDATNGELAKEAGVTITKTEDGQLIYEIAASQNSPGNDTELSSAQAGPKSNTLTTAKGETYQVKLPDGSLVWLNAASTLSYTPILKQYGIRRVKLEGEAYFKITKDKAHPFVVQTTAQEVEVLGTEFNLNSYTDEPVTATTLIEGSVKVKSGQRKQVIIPGQQLINNGTAFKVTQVQLDKITDWKDGEFNLDGLPFRTAMRKIARWYNVEVIYDSSVPDDMLSGGWISRETKLSTILEGIQKSRQVTFRLEGRTLYVSR